MITASTWNVSKRLEDILPVTTMRKYCTACEWAAETVEGYSADDLNVLAIEHHSVSSHPIESEEE